MVVELLLCKVGRHPVGGVGVEAGWALRWDLVYEEAVAKCTAGYDSLKAAMLEIA